MLQQIPCGIDEIIAVFGDIDDDDFERENIVLFELPYPLLYRSNVVTKSRAHRLAVPHFERALSEIERAGLIHEARNYSGIYNPRRKRDSAWPSTHHWGIAIDLEAATYPLGSKKRMPDRVIEIFEAAGFTYGGNFRRRPDPMHFQLCSGY